MTDFELTEYKIGDMLLKDMTAITFLGWVSNKLNGISQTSPTSSELIMLVRTPPMGQMPMENKIEIIRKLEKLGIEIK